MSYPQAALVASGSQELGYLKTTIRDVLVIIDRALPRLDGTKSAATERPKTGIVRLSPFPRI
jgi:hypothetical protein